GAEPERGEMKRQQHADEAIPKRSHAPHRQNGARIRCRVGWQEPEPCERAAEHQQRLGAGRTMVIMTQLSQARVRGASPNRRWCFGTTGGSQPNLTVEPTAAP